MVSEIWSHEINMSSLDEAQRRYDKMIAWKDEVALHIFGEKYYDLTAERKKVIDKEWDEQK